ncbi:hypothetical protein SAMN02745121_00555 [Nannocystis exedens]|uniref:Uncharacterized protein n=1 Tax=Nannocystis exedens TaxID=54 RepID=A0A1I1T8H7_9BACT|nr:hypothetical protein [Nannocystis exedens]PCC66714.1 hypothetical protein NAEX_09308 [Nannocystis exedens]SFD54929.1 hypothetical protein SAMN02745121_00555 [Nannocystis exedens]
MRRSICSPALCTVLLAACTVPNPAYHASQGLFESGSSDALSSTSAGGSATVAPTSGGSGAQSTADPTGATVSVTSEGDSTAAPMTSTTTPATTDADSGTTESVDTLATSTTDGDSTASTTTNDTATPKLDLSPGDVCPQVAAPNLEITVQHTPAPGTCNAALGPVIQGVLEAKPDANTFKFRACNLSQDCIQGNTQCLANQTIAVHVAGPDTAVPDIPLGTCVSVAYVGTGFSDANTCNTRMVRLARPGNLNNLASSMFVAGMGVPGTAELPVPWPDALEFTVAATQVQACPGNNVCGTPPGNYDLVGQFSGQEVVAGMGEAKLAKIPLYDQNHNPVGSIVGSFHNLRSYSSPADQCEFRWLWLADAYKP